MYVLASFFHNGDYSHTVSLGNVTIGTQVTVSVTRDQTNHRFLFNWTNKITNVTIPALLSYSFSDTTPAADPEKHLDVQLAPANCMGMSGTFNANNGISVFIIDSRSGALTQITGSPFTTGSDPQGIACDPAGKFLFTANSQDNTVSAFTIDSTSGALRPFSGSPFATATTPTAIAVDPAGQFLLVGASGNSGISVFSIDAATGAMSPISGSPFSTVNGVNGLAVARP